MADDVAYVALGSNVGDRHALLAAARGALSLLPGCTVLAASRVEETPPFGLVPQGPYLNQMIALRTTLDPEAVLHSLLHVEQRLGRVRGARWGARTIDLDLVQMGDHRRASSTLTLPHPGMAMRAFWQRERTELDALLAAKRRG